MGYGLWENRIRDFLQHMKRWTKLDFLFTIDFFAAYSIIQVDPTLFYFAPLLFFKMNRIGPTYLICAIGKKIDAK